MKVICSKPFQASHLRLKILTRDIALNYKRMPKETTREPESKRDTKIEGKAK